MSEAPAAGPGGDSPGPPGDPRPAFQPVIRGLSGPEPGVLEVLRGRWWALGVGLVLVALALGLSRRARSPEGPASDAHRPPSAEVQRFLASPMVQADLEVYREAAEAGEARAQLALGRVYLAGDGHHADPYTASQWLERAAAQGEPEAKLELAKLHGDCCPDRAKRWRAEASGAVGQVQELEQEPGQEEAPAGVAGDGGRGAGDVEALIERCEAARQRCREAFLAEFEPATWYYEQHPERSQPFDTRAPSEAELEGVGLGLATPEALDQAAQAARAGDRQAIARLNLFTVNYERQALGHEERARVQWEEYRERDRQGR